MEAFSIGSRYDPEDRRRHILPGFEDRCLVAYHIGLPNLECIEVQRDENSYYFLFWENSSVLTQARLLSNSEVEYLEHSYTHVDRYFEVLGSALGFSSAVFKRARMDASYLAGVLDGIITAHDWHYSLALPIAPLLGPDPLVERLRLLKDRIWDIVEMAAISDALAVGTRDTLPPSQGDSAPGS